MKNFPIESESSPVAALLVAAERAVASARPDAARRHFTHAVDLDESGVAAHAYGQFLWRQGEFAAALEHVRTALVQARLGGNQALVSVSANNLAVLFREIGDAESAARWQQRSWSVALSSDPQNPPQMGCDLSNRANDALLARDFELAEELFHRSLQWEVSLGTRSGEADDWGSLGHVAALRGKTEQALKYYRKALDLHVELQDERGVATDLLHIGQVLANLERWPAALLLLNRAVAMTEKLCHAPLLQEARQCLLEAKRRWRVVGAQPEWN